MRGAASLSVLLAMAAASGCGSDTAGSDACGIGVETNGTRAQATPLTPGASTTSCVGSASDVHYFEIASPGDPTGGYVQGTVEGSVGISIYAGGDAAEIAHVDPDPTGAPTAFFVAIAPGEDYQLGFAHQGAFAKAYTLTVTMTYTPVPDSFEPNDTLATAAPIAGIGTPVTAYLFGGRLGGDATAEPTDDYADYYRFSAVAGMVTLRIDGVPADVAPRLTLYTIDGSELARVANGVKGGAIQMSPSLVAPADVVIRVSPWSTAPPTMGAGAALPAHFTQPYTLTISQP